MPRHPSEGPLREVLRDFGSLRSGSNKNNRLTPPLLTRWVGLWLYTPPDSERLLPATLMSQTPPERALRADVWYLKEIAFGEGEARKNYKIITQNYNGCVGVFV